MFFPSFDSLNILTSLILSFALQAVLFLFAVLLVTDKVTDLAYSLAFIVLCLIFFFTGGGPLAPRLLLTTLVVAWGLRLGSYLFIRILKTGRDARFDGIRERPSKFAVFWAMQALTVWIVMLPVTVFLSMQEVPRSSPLYWIGALVWLCGIVIETLADGQKYRFRLDPANRGRWIDGGLWRYSRHPNFFGESLCWWGVFLATVPAWSGALWLTAAGPAAITLLLLFATGVPTVERSSDAKYGNDPGYQKYKRTTSLFVPLPPRKDPLES